MSTIHATGATGAATAPLLRGGGRHVRELLDPVETHLLQHLRDVTQEDLCGLFAETNDVVERHRTTPTTMATFLDEHRAPIQPIPTPSGHPA